MVVDVGVDRGELLQCLHLSEPEHCSLASSERQVAVLSAIVEPSAHLAAVEIAKVAHCGGVGPEAVSDDGFGAAVALQCPLHEGESRRFVTFLRDIGFQDFAFVINGTPEIYHLAVQLYVHFIEVLFPVPEPTHPANPLPPDVAGKQRPEPIPPEAHRFVADVDAAFKKQILNVSQRQWETDVHHYDQPDHLG